MFWPLQCRQPHPLLSMSANLSLDAGAQLEFMEIVVVVPSNLLCCSWQEVNWVVVDRVAGSIEALWCM